MSVAQIFVTEAASCPSPQPRSLCPSSSVMGVPCGSVINNLPVMQETQVQSLSQKDSLEKEMATHSSVLAWRIPGMGKPGGLPSMGSRRVGHD